MQSKSLKARAAAIMSGYDAQNDFIREHKRVFPRRAVIYQLLNEIRSLMFPGYFDDETLALFNAPSDAPYWTTR